MKITAIRTTTNAVGEYRVRHPMHALRELGHDTHVLTLDQEGLRVSNQQLLGDILVLARLTSTDVFTLLETIPPRMRPKIVYEVDDNPWEWHSWDPVHRELGFGYRRAVETVMSRCDAITCSTRTLAARIRQSFPGKPIWVVPNAIDYQIRDWTVREDRAEYDLQGKVVLGWTGSIHHGQDGYSLLLALPDVLEAHPDAVFLMQCDRSVYVQWTDGLKRQGFGRQLRWSPPVAFGTHPAVYSLFDINLAPLSSTKFNVCKSDLRLIEGGAQRCPYVASDIAPYREFHDQSSGSGGYLADTANEWSIGIDKAIKEREARGAALYSYVQQTRALSVVAGQWQTAYQAILAGNPVEETPAQWGGGRNDPCPCGSGQKRKRCHAGTYA